ncbi:hypothetical protein Syn6312_2891 [Synechococcus sp. PCC 6312]|nr:hypothetical protein Syn6312_2891 [Synechococcus sp. PCC 6312]
MDEQPNQPAWDEGDYYADNYHNYEDNQSIRGKTS